MNTITDIDELALFRIDENMFGIDINHIQEINKNLSFTSAHNSENYIKGILNLRGQIVTVIDLRVKFGRHMKKLEDGHRVIIVKYKGESVGLLVDSIEDIIEIKEEKIESGSARIEGVDSSYFSGIYKLENDLVIILDIEAILFEGESRSAAA